MSPKRAAPERMPHLAHWESAPVSVLRKKRLLRLLLLPSLGWIALLLILAYGAFTLWSRKKTWLSYYHIQWQVTPPILVISSDDWGGSDPLETPRDLQQLASILRKFKDAYGNHPIITAYMNPAAPDYENIIESDYQRYSWSFCYESEPALVEAWRSLCGEGLFEIQFHGREHWNVPLWLSALREDLPGFRRSCRQHTMRPHWGWDSLAEKDPRFRYLATSFIDASTNPPRALPLGTQEQMVSTGLDIIRRHFGTDPGIVTAPGHVWDLNTWKALQHGGIAYLESEPNLITAVGADLELITTNTRVQWFSSPHGVRAIVRNCSYEPNWPAQAHLASGDYTASATAELRSALWHARRRLMSGGLAVLSTHKYCYVGEGSARKEASLKGLERFLKEVRTEFPAIAFLSAGDLARYVHGGAQEAGRKIPFAKRNVSSADRLDNVVKCLWVCHWKFRLWVAALGVVFAWSLLVSVRRRKSRGRR